MSYIVVSGTGDRFTERIQRFLYDGQKIVGEVKTTDYGVKLLIVDTGTNNQYRSEYIRDRISSGMFGAVLFTSLPEAEAGIAERQK